MLNLQKKLAKISEELTMFFFSIDATKLSSVIEFDGKVGTVTFESNYNPEHSHALKAMVELLNTNPDETLENEYWELAGSGSPGEASQLLLIGVMTDKPIIEITPDNVKIVLTKNTN